ncbi:MAG: hypothetical protein R8K54_01840 [Mariprofundaceae bacterium]
MDCLLEIFDIRGDYPLKTGRMLPFAQAIEAKESFEQFKGSLKAEPEASQFVLGLNFEGSLADLICISEEGFKEIMGEAPESNQFYKQHRSQLPALTIAEQRNLRTVYRLLSQVFPDREYNDATVVEDMVAGASAADSNFSRCSNCNLPMYVEAKENHRCIRCHQENLCSYCLTSHHCTGA